MVLVWKKAVSWGIWGYLLVYNGVFCCDNTLQAKIRYTSLLNQKIFIHSSPLCKYSEQLMSKHSSPSLLRKPLGGVKLNLAVSEKQATCVWLTTQILCQQITRAFFWMLELSVWMLPNVYWKITYLKGGTRSGINKVKKKSMRRYVKHSRLFICTRLTADEPSK